MGACGCGDFVPQYKFEGPGDTVYTLEVINGCRYCEEVPKGVVISQLNTEDQEMFCVDVVPDLKFNDRDFKEAPIEIMSREWLTEKLKAGLNGVLDDKSPEYLDIVVEELVQDIFE